MINARSVRRAIKEAPSHSSHTPVAAPRITFHGIIAAEVEHARILRGFAGTLAAQPAHAEHGMSRPGRPKGEYRSAQREGTPVRPPGRPKGEYRSAQREGTPVSGAVADQGKTETW
jgi:hypothetical protein